VWLGYADPVATMEAARADDPSRATLDAVMTAWLKIIGTEKQMTAGEIIAKAVLAASDDRQPILKDAIAAIATQLGKGELDARKFGHWLGRNKHRTVGGIKILGEQDKHTKQQVWWLSRTAGT
jgi:hypothetical protein